MDGDRFDRILRSLARSWPRRSLTRPLASLALAGALVRDPFVAEANRKKKKKKRKKDRKKGECEPRCGGGTLCCNGRCVNVVSDRNNCGACGNICPKDPQNPARDYVCQGGQCVCSGTVCTNGRCCPANFNRRLLPSRLQLWRNVRAGLLPVRTSLPWKDYPAQPE